MLQSGTRHRPQLLDEEQMILEISEQESEINLDIWRRAYEMDYELREEEESTSWLGYADWYYWVFSGQPSRMERGAYLLKNTAPVDGSYHLIKCYKLPSAWTVSLAAYKNQNTPRPHAVHERREHHVVARGRRFARRPFQAPHDQSVARVSSEVHGVPTLRRCSSRWGDKRLDASASVASVMACVLAGHRWCRLRRVVASSRWLLGNGIAPPSSRPRVVAWRTPWEDSGRTEVNFESTTARNRPKQGGGTWRGLRLPTLAVA